MHCDFRQKSVCVPDAVESRHIEVGRPEPDQSARQHAEPEDAKRRDFTVNALYYDISKDEILDFYTGVADIHSKLLRTVETPEEVLSKDGVRILRLFRFQSELGFKIEKNTLETAIKYAK